MAVLTDDFLDTFLHYGGSASLAGTKWTTFIGSIPVAPTGDQFDGQFLGFPTSATHTLKTASRVCGIGAKAKGLVNAGGTQVMMEMRTTGGHVRVQINALGQIELVVNGATVATDTGTALTATPYYDIECFVDQGGAPGSAHNLKIETRVNGLRRPALTTTDWLAVGPHLDGGLTPPSATFATTFNSFYINNGGGSIYYVYAWCKTGSGATPPWTTVTTAGGTHAVKTDFVGVRKRAWLYVNAEGFYTLAGGNWDNGVGTTPTNVADSTSGMDSDGSYIENGTSGTAVAADRVSHAFTDLPPSATTIGFVQDVCALRNEGATVDVVKPFRRQAGTDYFDTDINPGSSYSMVPMALTQPPAGGTSVWTVALVNAIEAGLEQSTLTP